MTGIKGQWFEYREYMVGAGDGEGLSGEWESVSWRALACLRIWIIKDSQNFKQTTLMNINEWVLYDLFHAVI